MAERVTVEATISAPVQKVWDLYTLPQHITEWNSASDDWFTPRAENDLREGGRFLSRMEARDGSAGFDYAGVYNSVELHKSILSTLDDGRSVEVIFNDKGDSTDLQVTFDAESENSIEMQQEGWQAILDNFKKYVESH